MHNPYAPPTSELDSVNRTVPDPEEVLQYAGFWRRFGAYWIDVVILLPLAGVAYLVAEQSRMIYLCWLVSGLVIGVWFHFYLVARYGGTPGKLLLRTRIAMLDGGTITAKAAALRYAVLFALSVLSSIAFTIAVWNMSDQEFFSLGYVERSQRLVVSAPAWYQVVAILTQVWIWGEFISMLSNRKRRAVHDFIAGTVVVKSTKRT